MAQSTNGTLTTYAWDWAAPVPELLAQSTGSHSTPYLLGHETLGWAEGGEWRYVLLDALGSLRQVADGAGAVVAVREWEPYGQEVGGPQEGLGYTGEWQDAAVGLVYLRARWYAPGVGRFTQPDPREGDRQQPRSLHIYLYAHANPINLVDPVGLAAIPYSPCQPSPEDFSLCSSPGGSEALPVPFVSQHWLRPDPRSSYSCGPASLLMVLGYYRLEEPTPQRLFRVVQYSDEQGLLWPYAPYLDPQNFAPLAQGYVRDVLGTRMNTLSMENWTRYLLERHLQFRMPVIVDVRLGLSADIKAPSHFVVVVGLKRGNDGRCYVGIQDPWVDAGLMFPRSPTWEDWEKFKASWESKPDGVRRWGMVIWPY